jgi:hypothetical protein
VSASSLGKLSNLSLQSTASEFLEAKVDQLHGYKAYAEELKDGILEANSQQPTASPSKLIQWTLQPCIGMANKPLQVLKRQRTAITDEFTEVAARHQGPTEPSDEGLLERAYIDTILSRVMNASAKQSAVFIDKKGFEAPVNNYYGITAQRTDKNCLGAILPGIGQKPKL